MTATVAIVLGWVGPIEFTGVRSAFAVSSTATTIAAGNGHSCTIRSGQAFCWGDNNNGELGNNTTSASPVTTPVAVYTGGVLAGKTLIHIVTGNAFTCALDSTGIAYCWGWNVYGQLGDGTFTQRTAPVAVSTSGVLSGKTLTRITAGDAMACVLDSTGKVHCWGYGGDGELGNGVVGNSNIPVSVVSSGALFGKVITRIGSGYEHTCALDSAGKAYCWGFNSNGQLGNNSTTQSLTPVVVTTSGSAINGKTLTEIVAGNRYSCALDSAGKVYCWGLNTNGQLGNNSTTSSGLAVAVVSTGVLSGKTVNQITTGGSHACALDSAGLAYCWGNDSNGQLGDNSTTQSTVPVAVVTTGVLSGKTLTQISGGDAHTCTLDTANTVYCWGLNTKGQLGDRSTTQRTTAVLVTSQSPTGVNATPGDTTATISWTAPAFLNSSTGYRATASPGGASCTTSGALTCAITGLTDGTAYSVTVVTLMTVGQSDPSSAVNVTPAGFLTITVPASRSLPSATVGGTTSASLGTVTVTDNRALASASWTVTVSTTTFTTGGATSAETIPKTAIDYWSGTATSTSGTGTFTPGQATSANKQNLSVSRTAFSLTGGNNVNSAAWNPTVQVTIPASAVAGTYTARVTHSVA